MTTLLWDVRTAMEEQERQMIENIVNTKAKGHAQFWIFKHSNWRGQWDNVLKTTYKLFPYAKKPPRMLGTKLWKVDRGTGAIELEWELPLDVIVPEQCLDLDSASESVFNAAKLTPGAGMVS